MISTFEDVVKFIKDKNFKKIFILCGKNSFFTSGAENLLKKIENKKKKFFLKNLKFQLFKN